ncbi:MAG TPA: hypothetical protein VD701_08340 [Steroidobacteraceae bacterium]|nr:hypothetical protein [Steroidobacteraceae bacterium]
MANQLTIRIDVEDGIAVVSRTTGARSRALAVAAAAGTQVLAFTATAQNEPVNGADTTPILVPETTPILVPEQVAIIALAAAVGGFIGAVVGVRTARRKKKDDE